MDACRANNVTDFIVVHEHRGVPDGLIVSHLPHGPTAYFSMSDIVMRHDIPGQKWKRDLLLYKGCGSKSVYFQRIASI